MAKVSIKCQMLKSEYKAVEDFLRANFEMSRGDEKDFISMMIFYFANEELQLEEDSQDTFDFKKVINDFWEVQYEINQTEDSSCMIAAKIPIQTFTKLFNKQRSLYPEIAKCEGKVKRNFIVYLSYILVSSIKGGKLSPKFIVDKKIGIKQ